MDLFHLLHYGLAIVLLFIGVRMLGANYFEVPIVYALGLIVAALAGSALLSLLMPPAEPARTAE